MRFAFLVLVSFAFAWRVTAQIPIDSQHHAQLMLADLIEASAAEESSVLRSRIEKVLVETAKYARKAGVTEIQAERLPLPLRAFKPQLDAAIAEPNQESQLVDLVRALPESTLDRARLEVRDQIQSYKISETNEFKGLLEPGKGIEVKDPTMREFLHDVLPKYFDALPVRLKAPILVNVLRVPANASNEARLLAFLVESPPMTQKLFQAIGADATSPLVRDVMKELLSNLKKIPFEGGVDRIIERSLGAPIDHYFSEFSREPLAAASMGQVHIAKLKDSGEVVIVKILREGSRETVGEEWGVLSRVASKRLRATIDRLALSVLLEADLSREARNADKAKLSMEKTGLGLKVAGRVSAFPVTPSVLVVERAPGTQVSKVESAELLELSARALSTQLENWFEGAVFGNGEFHGDLHGGNLFLSEQTGKPGYALTAIDFGHYGHLAPGEQSEMINLFLAAATKSPGDAIDALQGLSGRTFSGIDRGDLSLRFKRTFARGLPLKERVSALLTDGLDSGVAIPEGLLSFDRGRGLIERQLSAKLAELRARGRGDLADELAPQKVYEKIFRRQGPGAFPRLLVPGRKPINALAAMKLLEILAKPELMNASVGAESVELAPIPPRAQSGHGARVREEDSSSLIRRVNGATGRPLRARDVNDLAKALEHSDPSTGDAARASLVNSTANCEALLKYLVSSP